MVLQSLNHLCGPSLVSLLYACVSMLETRFLMQLRMLLTTFSKSTLLAHIQLVYQDPQVLFCQAALQLQPVACEGISEVQACVVLLFQKCQQF